MEKKLSSRLKKSPSADDIVAECDRIKAHLSLAAYSLLRIYCYQAPPSSEVMFNPIDHTKVDLGASPLAVHNTSMLNALALKQDFALRLGETAAMGWRLGDKASKDLAQNPRMLTARDFAPNIKQKGVDLRIALDMARHSLRERLASLL
ncbi:MAG: hypothetical protein FWF31_01405 [Desulfobulbus sp.]|nr:hypothetical protein [Desulfobulbus sp.]